MTQTRIIVLGAGPAGAATALGLKRLGYQVSVIGEARSFSALEGISERVIQGMKHAGFKRATTDLPEPSARNASWNGETNQANTECLIDRQHVDQLIVQDLINADIPVIQQRVSQVSLDPVCQVTLTNGEHHQADFLVEARGRAAPVTGLQRFRGPETVSVLQHWQGPEIEPGSAAVSLPDGWAWMAAKQDGRRYLQLTLDVSEKKLPQKDQLTDYCAQRFRQIPQARAFIEHASPVGTPYGRISTPVLFEQTVGDNWIRVGDAAMAVDPLSGNGIFQALSSALQAPVVINTLIQCPERKALAREFYQQRVSGLFYRFARIGRDFYAMEERWQENSFWQQRRRWPDAEPGHQNVSFEQLRVNTMPVMNNNLIEARKVVVTPDQPLGIWHLGGIELAGVIEAIHEAPENTLKEQLSQFRFSDNQFRGLANWLIQNGYQGNIV
ncbi:flavin-dependent monooxygenase QhpG [Oceanospirillum sediminis]|uniref:Tryptophan 7-halogenase n=1 Tax=Oceanospirillum sediminis TaxID=2760088 RepID=A0A839ISQ2_9GAMM|nr:FAD-dependent oxidoreductase [Oceanospirillum sediminis]MBB1488008.1 tryptophan 7-halogenase [Oceanospirillum sediminis]